MADTANFNPDWLSPPGETIGDILIQKGMSIVEFARKIGLSEGAARGLLQGNFPISEGLATSLQETLGSSRAFWTSREMRYRDRLVQLQKSAEGDDSREWFSSIPIKDMVQMGWLDGRYGTNAAACLRFFGVSNLVDWKKEYEAVLGSAALRTTIAFESNPVALATWLRQGELQSASIRCAPWSVDKFERALPVIRTLSRERDPKVFIPVLQEELAACGVAMLVLRAPSGCRASGAAKFLTASKALLLLSGRYLSDDQFWFSVFHEAGHLMKHPDKLFVDAPTMPTSREEVEANQFAQDLLVPQQYRAEMLELPIDGRAVIRFARKIGISPGIVVGQLQHAGRYTRRQLNNLKRRYTWADAS